MQSIFSSNLVKVFGLLVLFSTSSCNNGNGPVTVNCDYDLAAMLSNIASSRINNAYGLFQTQMSELNVSANTFINQPNAGNLNTLKDKFSLAYLSYQGISTFEFGPAVEGSGVFRERFNTFPTDTQGIEDAIVNEKLDLDNSFKSVVGLPAMEYLIYGKPGVEADSIIRLFSTAPNAVKRGAYLSALGEDLVKKSETVQLKWSVSGGNYTQSFIESTGNADGSSLSLLVNEFNFDYEILKNFKFKIPLGRLNGGQILAENLEGYYAGISAELALAHARSLYNLYLGRSDAGVDGEGFDDYLRCLQTGADTADGLLADAIDDQFNVVISKLEALNDPLSDVLVSNKAAVDEAYTEMQKLLPLVKREMTAAFGVKISYVDNDGD